MIYIWYSAYYWFQVRRRAYVHVHFLIHTDIILIVQFDFYCFSSSYTDNGIAQVELSRCCTFYPAIEDLLSERWILCFMVEICQQKTISGGSHICTAVVQPQYKYELFHMYCTSFHWTGRYELNKLTSLPMCGFIAQLAESCTGIAKVTGSNPVKALIFFFRHLLSSCLNLKIYCNDHSLH